MAEGSQAVVTVTPTIMDGTVVRWFTGLEAAERCRPFLSASRYEVITHVEGVVTPDLREQANAVRDGLPHFGPTPEWVERLATHRRRGITGPMEPETTPARTTSRSDRA